VIDLIVRGGDVHDGTGGPPRRLDVGVRGGRIAELRDLTGVEASRVVDAAGCAVAPGFIDHHQHGDVTPLVDGRCVSALAQGVTLLVFGNCGHGVSPGCDPRYRSAAIIGFREGWDLELDWPTYRDYFDTLEASRLGTNVAAFAAHGAIRLAVMGQRPGPPTAPELARMKAMVEEAMQAGAVGLSSGLEYTPGGHADEPELTALSRVVGRQGGAYASHIRDRGETFIDAVREAIRVAEQGGARLILSHLAPRPYAAPTAWARVRELIEDGLARGMDITIDTFPDAWGPSPIASLLPSWIIEGPRSDVLDNLGRPDVLAAARATFDARDNHLLRTDGAENLRLTSSTAHGDLVGKTLADIGAAWRMHLADVVCTLLRDEGTDFYSVLIEHRYARDEDLATLYADPLCAFESDGVVTAPDGPLADLTMNRSTYGYTARVLGELVRDGNVLTLEEAIRRMTSLPAAAVGLYDRGVIREEAPADLVVFDPLTIRDRSTDSQQNVTPIGISAVVVDGALALEGGHLTEERAGHFLSRPHVGRTAVDVH
jgi:N-acyl-D-amino-acid deacylase